jgi:hypothetical protein
MVSQFGKNMNYSLTDDQLCQIIEAILNGKYSWACLLMLQYNGYNPLHYIPYRTYNRLMKEHNGCQKGKHTQKTRDNTSSLEVDNLPHLRAVDNPSRRVKGGNSFYDLEGSLSFLA